MVLKLAAAMVAFHGFLAQHGLVLSLESFTKVCVWLVIIFSFALCLVLLGHVSGSTRPQPDPRCQLAIGQARLLTPPLLIGFALANYLARFEFGDLQHLFALAFVPFVVLRWLKSSGVEVNFWLTLVIGIFAGWGVALDLTFWPAVIILELLLALQCGRSWLKVLPIGEYFGLLLGLAFALINFMLLTDSQKTAFVKWIMPLRMLSFHEYDRILDPAVHSPDRRDVLYMLLFALPFSVLASKQYKACASFGGLALFGLALYVVEHQGLSNQILVCQFFSIILLAISAFYIFDRVTSPFLAIGRVRSIVILLACTCLAGAVYKADLAAFNTAYGLAASRGPSMPVDIFEVVDKKTAWKDPVMIFSYAPHAIFPLLNTVDRKQMGYLLWSEPIILISLRGDGEDLSPDLKEFQSYLVHRLKMDVGSARAKLIIVDSVRIEEFMENRGLFKAIRKNYVEDPACIYFNDFKEPREDLGYGVYNYRVFRLKTEAPSPIEGAPH